MYCLGGAQRAVEGQGQRNQSQSPVQWHRPSCAACIFTYLRCQACASGSRYTHHRGGCLAKLSPASSGSTAEHSSLSTRWCISKKLRTQNRPCPRLQAFWNVCVFEERCSLAQIGAQGDAANQLAPQAQFRPRAFEKCSALRQISFEKTEYDPANLTRCLPECCFLEAGIVSLHLPADFNWIGPAACELCKRLQLVDLSRTDISEILGSTFARCSQLERLSLANKLRRIGREAFLNCTSLREVHAPPAWLCCMLLDEPLQGAHNFAHFTNQKPELPGEGHTRNLVPLTNAVNWTSRGGFTSSHRIETIVVRGGLTIFTRSCARTCSSCANCSGLHPRAGPANNMNMPNDIVQQH